MENGRRVRQKISSEDVISKLKDDGDFDRLRLKIIRKIKDNVSLSYLIYFIQFPLLVFCLGFRHYILRCIG